MDLKIRQIKESDNVTLAKIIRVAFIEFDAPKTGTVYSDPTTDNLFDLFKTERSVLWVAEHDGKIAGCCGIYPTPALPEGHVELVKFYLAAEARGKGIGKALLLKSIVSAKELGYKTIYLESLPEYDTAIKLYEKTNFKHIDHQLGVSGHSSCNVWMSLNLNDESK